MNRTPVADATTQPLSQLDGPSTPSWLERLLRPLGRVSVRDERFALVGQALIVAALLVWLKWILHRFDFQPIESVPLLTALLGGVIFTLAILLAATLQDYKESERLVGEFATLLRRLPAEFAMVRRDAAILARVDEAALGIVRSLNADLKRGFAVGMKAVHAQFADLDAALDRMAEGGRLPVMRSAQVTLASLTRIADRLEVIVETSFTRAGYTFAGVVTAAALAAFGLTRVVPFTQGLLLYGFASFLLSGLFLLIWDLDNPFSGHARISTFQLDKVEAFYRERLAARSGVTVDVHAA